MCQLDYFCFIAVNMLLFMIPFKASIFDVLKNKNVYEFDFLNLIEMVENRGKS